MSHAEWMVRTAVSRRLDKGTDDVSWQHGKVGALAIGGVAVFLAASVGTGAQALLSTPSPAPAVDVLVDQGSEAAATVTPSATTESTAKPKISSTLRATEAPKIAAVVWLAQPRLSEAGDENSAEAGDAQDSGSAAEDQGDGQSVGHGSDPAGTSASDGSGEND